MRLILSALILFGLISCVSIDRVLLLQKEGFVFSDLTDESKLVSYFLNTNQKSYFQKLNTEDKWEFLSNFWHIQDPNSSTVENEFQHEIVARVKYANKHFSHFKDGWETDMGKVYIKYGEPFEILKLSNYGESFEIFEPQSSGHYVKLTMREYQIWKYRISSFQTFLFIDPQQHKDFRLIFSDGDEQEGSWQNYKDYLGTDFDATLLN